MRNTQNTQAQARVTAWNAAQLESAALSWADKVLIATGGVWAECLAAFADAQIHAGSSFNNFVRKFTDRLSTVCELSGLSPDTPQRAARILARAVDCRIDLAGGINGKPWSCAALTRAVEEEEEKAAEAAKEEKEALLIERQEKADAGDTKAQQILANMQTREHNKKVAQNNKKRESAKKAMEKAAEKAEEVQLDPLSLYAWDRLLKAAFNAAIAAGITVEEFTAKACALADNEKRKAPTTKAA